MDRRENKIKRNDIKVDMDVGSAAGREKTKRFNMHIPAHQQTKGGKDRETKAGYTLISEWRLVRWVCRLGDPIWSVVDFDRLQVRGTGYARTRRDVRCWVSRLRDASCR